MFHLFKIKISKIAIFTSLYLVISGGLFFVGTSAYQYYTQRPNFIKWSSPDETANYFFSKLYAETGQLTISNKISMPEAEIVRPRSFKAPQGVFEPISFLGLPLLYGFIAKLLSINILPYLTPLFGVLGLWFFFGLVKRIFNQPTALIATTLATTFPVYWYYSSRSMFHNILFIVAGLGSLYCGLRAVERIRLVRRQVRRHWPVLIWLALSGLAFGLAVATRTSELLWLGPVLVILIIFYFKEIGWYRWLWWLVWSWTIMLPVTFWNIILHGRWYGGGYPDMEQSVSTLGQTGLSLFNWHNFTDGSLLMTKLELLKKTIFYFGFWPQQSWIIFRHYVLEMFPWLLPLAAIGVIIFIFGWHQWSKEKWLYLFSWLLISIFLVVYYGSWRFTDNPDPNSVTIGNSYTRYWLPLYLGALPWAADGLRRLVYFLFRQQVAKHIVVVAVALICLWSIRFTASGSEEGLIPSAQRQIASYRLWSEVMSKTESDSIIITQYQDKLFFPERQVIVGLFDNEVMNQYYGRLAQNYPLYYFNFRFQPVDLEYLNNRRLFKFGYLLREVWQDQEFSLYHLEQTDQSRLDQK